MRDAPYETKDVKDVHRDFLNVNCPQKLNKTVAEEVAPLVAVVLFKYVIATELNFLFGSIAYLGVDILA
jgi:hypothetical protein